MGIDVTQAILLSGLSGLVTAVGTVVALRTDITWIKREVVRLEQSVIRAHERIDNMEKAR